MNFGVPLAAEIIQSVNQVNMISVSELLSDISRVFQKPLKYFKGAVTPTHFLLPPEWALPLMLSFGSALYYCYKPPVIILTITNIF